MARKTKYIIKWETIEYGEALIESPERNLLQAIIVRAIKDLKNIRSSIDDRRDAEDWFLGKDFGGVLFEDVADLLGINVKCFLDAIGLKNIKLERLSVCQTKKN